MNEVHKTTIKDRIRNAVAAFRGKPLQSLTYGVEVRRCDKCERVDPNIIINEIEKELDESRNYGCEMEYRAGLYRALDIVEKEAKG